MNCSESQNLISAYIDDELSGREIRKLLAHFEDCSVCKEELAKYTRQKEAVAALRSSYVGPVPTPDFAESVMAEISREESAAEDKNLPHLIRQFCQPFLFLLRRPALAIVCFLILVMGAVSGTFWDSFFPSKSEKRLMSVYELQAQNVSGQNVTVAHNKTEEDSIVFHHIARSSRETLAAKPCLLEYTAYTSSVPENY